MHHLITNAPLTKITLHQGDPIMVADNTDKIIRWLMDWDVYFKGITTLVKTSSVKLVEVASTVEKFEYYEMDKLQPQVKNLLKDKIQQARDARTDDKITPETLTRWIETIREHISYYQETKRDNSPEAIERRRKQIEATKAKLAQKLWTSTQQ